MCDLVVEHGAVEGASREANFLSALRIFHGEEGQDAAQNISDPDFPSCTSGEPRWRFSSS